MAKAKNENVFGDKIATPRGQFSFPHIAKADTDGQYADDKYKVTLLMPGDADLKPLKRAILDVAKKKWPKSVKKLSDVKLLPFRNGDDKPQLQGYEGTIFITCKSRKRPDCRDATRNKIDVEELDDYFYGGAYGRLVVIPMTYEQGGQKGVTFLLDTIQHKKDGERFGSGTSGADLLDDDEDEDDVEDDDLDDMDEEEDDVDFDDDDLDDLD